MEPPILISDKTISIVTKGTPQYTVLKGHQSGGVLHAVWSGNILLKALICGGVSVTAQVLEREVTWFMGDAELLSYQAHRLTVPQSRLQYQGGE